MVLNTQQLQCLIEIERTRSISQAAQNLYMGQPNLSRLLRDTEEAVGFPIFDRTRKGVRPTEKGAVFLQHARNILRETDFMERLGPNNALPNRFRICLPRSYTLTSATQEYLASLSPETRLDAMIRECHPRQALDMLDSGSAELAVIRYSMEYQDYFTEQTTARKLNLQLLSTLEYQVLLRSNAVPAGTQLLTKAALEGRTELMHRDTFYPQSKSPEAPKRRIYTVDRLAQLQFLSQMPETYLWSEPLPASVLKKYDLIQLPCEGASRYRNALVYRLQCPMSEIERDFIEWIRTRA